MTEIAVNAPAKVNLFLRILARETSGFHGLETLFCGLDLADRLELRRRPGGEISLEVTGPWDTGAADRNLAVRAARAYLARAGLEDEGVEIGLEKRIPPGSGLGGGSSDAAATLRAMNRLFGMALPEHALLSIGARLGSDVPFFLAPSPLALAWDRGQRLFALPPLPVASVVLAWPGEGMSTATAYRALARKREADGDGERRPDAGVLTPDEVGSWRAVAELAVNDFESVVFEERPRARDVVADLREAGASPALLSGSGAAVFGVFPSDDEAEAVGSRLRDRYDDVELIAVRTLEEWPVP